MFAHDVLQLHLSVKYIGLGEGLCCRTFFSNIVFNVCDSIYCKFHLLNNCFISSLLFIVVGACLSICCGVWCCLQLLQSWMASLAVTAL